MSMTDTIDDLKQRGALREQQAHALEHETIDWLMKLMENCRSDRANAQTYLQNAAVEVGTFAADAIAILSLVENAIQPMRTSRKMKHNPIAQSVMPYLVLGKLLKELQERGK